MLPVVWQKNNQNNEWFDFLRLNLDASYFQGKRGVFAIWYQSTLPKVIKVGSGNIGEQLKTLRLNPAILQYAENGPLKVSWVVANGILKDEDIAGAEAYLHDIYNPLVGERNPAQQVEIKHIQK